MLDIKFIRENKDLITEAARKKRIKFSVDKLIEADEERRKILASVEAKRTVQNDFNNKVVSETNATLKLQLIDGMRQVKEELQNEEENLKKVMKEWQSLMLQVPNIPDVSVPEGDSDADNKEIKKWGNITEFAFKPKNHIEIMKSLDMVDFDRGTKVAGFRGYFLKNDGALLSLAIWNYAVEFFTKKGFAFYIVPSLVRRENLMGTGFIPQGEDDLYKTQDGDYLAGTAEVGLMGLHDNEILDKKDFPKKYLGFSPCFRREAGSHSKDVKGLIRVHEFYKLEQVILCEANHEESVRLHEELNRNTEEFIESLGIPYHTVINCGADLGLGQVKKYDIELWVPLENTYREIASASYFHDFQTRRLNIRYKDGDGKTKFAHSLNCTAIPTPRVLVSLVENYQQADGSVAIPEVLRPYMGGRDFIKKM
ncbi:MAG: serine--tRNA ligase [Candidatus Zambryskibacteria bacterium RIFCSPHIGHO2_01_FULL_43_27]|uniref:Serine--tRNA ligase n=1 Tax=Candidatus Zambryskibacteria bacterium RIFCSPLOWO2_01_FULL_43_17 TaxID=1802760 RepID=A0A1G2U5S7_9BACT|nr:MAG: serine--tRNA ligase [Candidatus Zambryskibacteria bacterium RIFCSPHIGHO2_01_FULL_43_27]OHA99469.1 MAG: serine--tRNA ligase [Candidatus Zambryskibacteria bacterium RIFCSPHIGHO2_12_FULL_43_12b]OHB04310.1 MAG: serine--tRNA ligase [Candidatus Zambryskibacteria bacterium RIFCSPLOWO2_01_FULL_43_17]